MIELDTINGMLDDIAEKLPPEIFRELNGGVVLTPDIKYHPEAKGQDLYIMGEYHREREMGRYIMMYGGSFQAMYGEGTKQRMRQELEKTLKHEFVHHLESLAGEKDLEIEDARQLARFKRMGF
jgi:hypothetical protein